LTPFDDAIDIYVATGNGLFSDVENKMHADLIVIRTAQIGQALQLANVIVIFPIYVPLGFHDQEVLLLADVVHDDVGPDFAEPQRPFYIPILEPLLFLLSPVPLWAYRPIGKLGLHDSSEPGSNCLLTWIAINKVIPVQQFKHSLDEAG
jgi:hypothetical protein